MRTHRAGDLEGPEGEPRPRGPERGSDPPDLQILTTEHWSLLATRSQSWNEAFARSQMFLTVVSAAVVALALVAQGTDFGGGFVAFSLVILPVVLFLGIATFVRLVAVNVDEGRWVIGMNRIRAAYLELAPHLDRYFVTSHHDDVAGAMLTAGWGTFPRLRGFVTTPAIVAVVCAVIAAMIAFLATSTIGLSVPVSVAVGAAAGVTVVLAGGRYQAAAWAKQAQTGGPPVNPTPADESAPC